MVAGGITVNQRRRGDLAPRGDVAARPSGFGRAGAGGARGERGGGRGR